MEKFVKVVLNVLFWTIMSISVGLITIAALIGWAEGDLSKGIFEYLLY